MTTDSYCVSQIKMIGIDFWQTIELKLGDISQSQSQHTSADSLLCYQWYILIQGSIFKAALKCPLFFLRGV